MSEGDETVPVARPPAAEVGAPAAERLSAALARYRSDVAEARERLLEATRAVFGTAELDQQTNAVAPGRTTDEPSADWAPPRPDSWVPGPPQT